VLKSLKDVQIVVAKGDENGTARFVDITPEVRGSEFVESAQVWRLDSAPTIPHDVGSLPTAESSAIPEINGTKVALICFLPHSAGKSHIEAGMDPRIHPDESDPEMHWTHSIDYEFVLSGKIDFELPGGEVKTLGPGSCLIVGGVPHAWKNRYDEPCIYAAVMVGARVER
jgi:hypothetical protein